jgi:hypothetical protein
VNEHAPVPEQTVLLHPPNTDPEAGVSARLIAVPEAKVAEHVDPQLMPDGVLVTVPDPVPDFVNVNVNVGTNVAVTEVFEFIVTTHGPVPVHAPPLQPENALPAFGAAVSVTCVPGANDAEQVLPQLIPDGELVTVPLPEVVTVNV